MYYIYLFSFSNNGGARLGDNKPKILTWWQCSSSCGCSSGNGRGLFWRPSSSSRPWRGWIIIVCYILDCGEWSWWLPSCWWSVVYLWPRVHPPSSGWGFFCSSWASIWSTWRECFHIPRWARCIHFPHSAHCGWIRIRWYANYASIQGRGSSVVVFGSFICIKDIKYCTDMKMYSYN